MGEINKGCVFHAVRFMTGFTVRYLTGRNFQFGTVVVG